MTNQVILYDRTSNTVKLIDGIKSISLKKAQELGFTPAYLMRLAVELLTLNHDQASQNALTAVKDALDQCPTSKWDIVKNIIAYDRMSDKVKIFGGAITIPFKIALHKGVTPTHMMHMAGQLLSLSKYSKDKKALTLAEKAEFVCKNAENNHPEYQNKHYK